MNDITTHREQLPDIPQSDELKSLCRTADTLSVGDCFLRGSDLIQIAELITNNNGETIVRYNLISDLEEKEIYTSYGTDEISSFIKEYGHRYIPDPYKLYSRAIDFLNGTYMPELPEDENKSEKMEDSTALVGNNAHQGLIALAQRNELLVRQLSDLELMANYHKSVLENRMRSQIRRLKETCDRFRNQLNNIQKALSMIQLYLGDEHCVEQLSSGLPAPADTKLSIHQQLLFMDEECGIITDGGIDIERIEEFDRWLIQGKHLDSILPDLKGIVALKPRRFRKQYGVPYYDSMMAHWNRHTFFLIRNGENIYRIDSEHIEVTERLFPLRSEMQQLYDLAAQSTDCNQEEYSKRIQTANERYHRIILFIQGLIDHTVVFSPVPQGINLFKPDSYAGWINLIYDDEASLTDGRQSFENWIKQINTSIRRGSRIVYCQPDRRIIGWEKGCLTRFANSHLLRYYYNDYTVPELPISGVYTVDSIIHEGNDYLAFRYNPKDDVYCSDYYGERRNRLTFRLRSGDIYLNYDGISLEEIEYYLNSRLERKSYLEILPVLLEVRKSLQAEQQQEDAFRLMMIGELQQAGISIADAKTRITEAIDWWKYKNIWKRPISNDDAKALRMIKQRVLKSVRGS